MSITEFHLALFRGSKCRITHYHHADATANVDKWIELCVGGSRNVAIKTQHELVFGIQLYSTFCREHPIIVSTVVTSGLVIIDVVDKVLVFECRVKGQPLMGI